MQLVANLGFPAIVTMYLLIRIERKLVKVIFLY
ncbi:MAG: YvrJ family protein [Romboutsia sp.]